VIVLYSSVVPHRFLCTGKLVARCSGRRSIRSVLFSNNSRLCNNNNSSSRNNSSANNGLVARNNM